MSEKDKNKPKKPTTNFTRPQRPLHESETYLSKIKTRKKK